MHRIPIHKNFMLPLISMTLWAFIANGQNPVRASADPDNLFHSSNPHLNRNKQVAYHIVKDLLEANHWELADQFIAKDYIQHNPNAANGRAAVVAFFTQILKVHATPIPKKMKTKVVSVIAEGDLVTVATVSEQRDSADPSKMYTTTWFDQWRILNGKAVEHWDGALKR